VLCKLTITKVSCNKTEHTVEYCNGYRAGAVQSDVDDDPDDNTIPLKLYVKAVVLVQNTVVDIS